MTPFDSLKLYGYWRSSSSWRVRAGLEAKGLEYEYVAVHLVEDGGQQHADDFVARNPMHQVPLLEAEVGGERHRIGQSLAILEFLEEMAPLPGILPADPVERALCRQLAEIINSGTQPLQNLAVIQHLRDELGVDHVAFCQRYIRKGLLAYQATLPEHAGPFSLPGMMPTVADMCLVPQLYNARRFSLEMSEFPRLLEIEARCMSHPAFERSHPDQQPDAQ